MKTDACDNMRHRESNVCAKGHGPRLDSKRSCISLAWRGLDGQQTAQYDNYLRGVAGPAERSTFCAHSAVDNVPTSGAPREVTNRGNGQRLYTKDLHAHG